MNIWYYIGLFLLVSIVVFVYTHEREVRLTGKHGGPDIDGNSAKYFVCTDHNFRKLVSVYNPEDPPTCPACGKELKKGE